LAPSLRKIAALAAAAISAYAISYPILLTAFSSNVAGSPGADLYTLKLASGVTGLIFAFAVNRLYGKGREMVGRLLSKIRGYAEKIKERSMSITGRGRGTVERDDE
jgi:hypothetical protein